ncbi:MAG: PAS domain-containing protein [Thermoguttaceae bacterium]|jgi:PAS domain S-box-containing protein|nr:PAS domain-containing protein [Thermoguttaceae bacterium]
MAAKKSEGASSLHASSSRKCRRKRPPPNEPNAEAGLPAGASVSQAEEQWQQTFDAVPEPIAVLDLQHRIVRLNKNMAERLGLAKDQCVGQTCYRLVHGIDEPPSFCPHSRLLKDGEEHSVEIDENRLGGEFLVTGYPSTETAIRSIDLSVVGYLTKPLDLDELLCHVKPAIAHSQYRRAVTVILERLQSCVDDLNDIHWIRIPRAGAKCELVSLSTIRTLAACLSELVGLYSRSGGEGCAESLCELIGCPMLPVHRQAIVDTIAVLKKTKDTFKSKELAELRTRLEALLHMGSLT